MRIGFYLYDGFTTLDIIGAYEVLSRLPGADATFIAKEAGMVASDTRLVDLYAPVGIDEVDALDILVVPGGMTDDQVRDDPHQMAWFEKITKTTQVNASVCTGSLIYAAAGLLKGRTATTHWARYDVLSSYGAEPVSERWVDHGDIITAAGVSAGIDMALALTARLAGEDYAKALQLAIEYDPAPPFNSGNAKNADPALIELVAGTMAPSADAPRALTHATHRVSNGS